MNQEQIAEIFNEMREEYDDLRDLWYSWLFSRLHFLIARDIIQRTRPTKVLDVGCGTGFQSFLFATSGSEVTGVDIAKDLINKAQEKCEKFDPNICMDLFPVHFPFVERYNKRIMECIGPAIKYQRPIFKKGDAQKLDFPDNSFDHVNCCGSTLNFIENYQHALTEISRVLKPKGTFSIEVDARWNIDIFWPIVDNFFFGALKYDMSLKESLNAIFQPMHSHIKIDYPFGEPRNPVMMNIWLFTKRAMKKDLENVQLNVTQNYSIHSFTNLIPSTILDSPRPNRLTKILFEMISRFDEFPLFNQCPGCSLVFFGEKK